MKRLNALIYEFVWGSKWKRISKLNLSCFVEVGGAEMYVAFTLLCVSFAVETFATFFSLLLPFSSAMVCFGNRSYKRITYLKRFKF